MSGPRVLLTTLSVRRSIQITASALVRLQGKGQACRQQAYTSATEIAEADKISKSYASPILRLALLAPDLVEAILDGWADQRLCPEHFSKHVRCGARVNQKY